MDKQNQLWFFFQFLQEVEKELSKEEEKQVMIEKAINLKLMCDYVVSCSYGDIVLIICMLRDYVKMLDEVRSDIQEERSNQYFMLSDCEYPEDIDCKVLEWLSRAACKGAPFKQEWRNRKFRKFMLDGINNFLDTNFSEEEMGEIYTYLGNACNHTKTMQFVESGFDIKVLKEVAT